MFIYPNRVDCSVNSGLVDNLYSAAPVLHTQTSGNVGGGFNDLLKIGDKVYKKIGGKLVAATVISLNPLTMATQ